MLFTEEEKIEARDIWMSRDPIFKLGNYLNSRYLSIVSDDSVAQIDQRIPNHIPKTIVLFWHDKQLPEEILQSIQKIKEHNVGYQFVLFDAEQAYDFIQCYYGQELASLYKRRCIHPAMQSDMFRICYLLQKGGIYVDVDIDCFHLLDNIFAQQNFDCFLLYAIGNPCCIENGFIGTAPHISLLSIWLEKIQENLTIDKGLDSIWACTGPGVISLLVLELLANRILEDESFSSPLDNLKLAPNSFTGRAYGHAELSYKRSVMGNWRRFRLSKDLYCL